jgi:hypothetical protein
MRAVELPCCEAASIESVAPQSLGSMAPVLQRGASARIRPHGMFFWAEVEKMKILGGGGLRERGGGEREREREG